MAKLLNAHPWLDFSILAFKSDPTLDVGKVAQILRVNAADIIHGEDLFKPGAGRTQPAGGPILFLENLGQAVVLLDQAEIDRLRADPSVNTVAKNLPVSASQGKPTGKVSQPTGQAPLALPAFWNIDMVSAPRAWTKTKGENVKVAILDTGIAHHPAIKVEGGHYCIFSGNDTIPSMQPEAYDDEDGHGTHIAGIIGACHEGWGMYGVAPKSLLYAVKVLEFTEISGHWASVLLGLEWCCKERMDVANLSLQIIESPFLSAQEVKNIEQHLLEVGMALKRKEVFLVAAAGNKPLGQETSISRLTLPGRSEPFLAVGAIDRKRNLYTQSLFSSEEKAASARNVELVAPGVQVSSARIGGEGNDLGKWIKPESGTSMACAHVSGAVALIKGLPGFNLAYEDVREEVLKKQADELSLSMPTDSFGYGLLNCGEAVQFAELRIRATSPTGNLNQHRR